MNRNKTKYGFSLIEALVALMTAAMTLVVVFAIYDRAQRASASITQKLDSYILPSEILQKIAEDLDRVAAPGSNAAITVVNNYQNGLPAAQLTISSQVVDKDNNKKTLEKVVWQTDYDLATGRLILYRSHSGLIWEDNLLDKAQRADWSPDRQLFVPLCTGISYFRVQVPEPQNLVQKADALASQFSQTKQTSQFQEQAEPEEQKFLDAWSQNQLPPAILVTISFADPIENRGVGGAEVPDEQKIKRMIVIDRSKKMNFVYVPMADANQLLAETEDANATAAPVSSEQQGQNALVPDGGTGGSESQSFSDRSRRPGRSRRFRQSIQSPRE
jgi:Tfp pilus assembly protein PilV